MAQKNRLHEFSSESVIALVRDLLVRAQSELQLQGEDYKTAALSKQLGIGRTRLTQIKSPSQQAKEISDDEIVAIINFAIGVAEKAPNGPFKAHVWDAIEKLPEVLLGNTAVKIRGMLGGGLAVRRALGLRAGPQEDFIREYCGNYLLFRRDARGQVIVSALTVKAPETSRDLPTFQNIRQTQGADRSASGIIYYHDPYVYALGYLKESGSARLLILRSCKKFDSNDLIGMRLGVSPLDGSAAFAHPIYCRKVGSRVRLEKLTGEYATPVEAARALEKVCPKLQEILKALKKAVTLGSQDDDKDAQHLWTYGLGLHNNL